MCNSINKLSEDDLTDEELKCLELAYNKWQIFIGGC